MFKPELTHQQMQTLIGALDLTIKQLGLSCLENVLPVLSVLQSTKPETDNVVPIKPPAEAPAA